MAEHWKITLRLALAWVLAHCLPSEIISLSMSMTSPHDLICEGERSSPLTQELALPMRPCSRGSPPFAFSTTTSWKKVSESLILSGVVVTRLVKVLEAIATEG